MKTNIEKTTHSLLLGAAVLGLAIGTSAFTTRVAELEPGEFRFYNKSSTPNNPNHNEYVYRTNASMCSEEGPVCSEVWDIGTISAPADGTLLSSYSSPTHVGNLQPGQYTGN